MEFGRIVAIDWSGAKSPEKRIQVAEYLPGKNIVTLVPPPRKSKWTRTMVWDQYFGGDSIESALIGIDFAFAYPYCDKGAYFPGHPQTPPNVTSLWAEVDAICADRPDFYGGPFYLTEKAKFSDHLMYQEYTGPKYRERFRQTEVACKCAGIDPKDVFKCVGPTVGVGSVAGFRFLSKIKTENVAHIWPFCGEPAPSGTTVVEIYPSRFLNCAEVYLNKGSNLDQVKAALKYYDVCLSPDLTDRDFTGDERDALVSAAGMKWWLNCKGPSAWEAVERSCAMYEGWIFGI